MKDMSFFLLKNAFGAKRKKGFRTFCNNDGSTSTLNQQNLPNSAKVANNQRDLPSKASSPFLPDENPRQSTPTLEEMILQLELEEEIARKAKLNEYGGIRGRMSCVNNSDILRSARNALNQYPRFSLDGRDAMYRSSFGNMEARKSVCCDRILGGRLLDENELDINFVSLPSTLAGQSVVWCKPGVVAKLMGLEAMPVPVRSKKPGGKERLDSHMGRQNLRRKFERHDLERRLAMEMHGYGGIRRNNSSCCSRNGYCIMKPVALEPQAGGVASGWPRRRFV